MPTLKRDMSVHSSEVGGAARSPTHNLRLLLASFSLETLYDYVPGGHHPVHLGDLLGNGNQYRVIHKLGSGGFATVWLVQNVQAQETTKYAALKILTADCSTEDSPERWVNSLDTLRITDNNYADGAKYIALFSNQFKITGPNGEHLCFVNPVPGPKVSLGLLATSKDPGQMSKDISRKVVEATNFLHTRGICHGGQLY